ncbi:hypothetical protein ANTPLA_LOCUS2706 [Anthophora plagiata]
MSKTPPKSSSPAGSRPSPGSPSTPSRGSRLSDRVNFFVEFFEDKEAKRNVTHFRSPTNPRPSSRASDSSFEESFEKLVEEGELNGSKVVKFEKITVRKSIREISGTSSVSSQRLLTEASRTPSEEHTPEDSAYQSHSHDAPNHGSKSSSIGSFTRFPSEESLSQRRGSNPQQHLLLDDRTSSEWYAKCRARSFQNVASRIEYVRSKSEYDAHIAEIKGISPLSFVGSWCRGERWGCR